MDPEVATDAGSKPAELEWSKQELVVAYLRELQVRFNHLTGLRATTAHRHIMLLGFVATGLGALSRMDEVEEIFPLMLLLTSIVLLAMSLCVTIYDAMVRLRARPVAQEMAHVVRRASISMFGASADSPRFGEDFFFFSQIVAANAVTVVPLLLWLWKAIPGCGLGPDSSLCGLCALFYLSGLVLFTTVWWLAGRVYRPANTWLPSA